MPQDDDEATRLYRRAAEQGNPFGQLNYGKCLHEGRGVPQDDREAARLALFVAGLRFSPAQLWGMLRTWQGWPAGHLRSCSVLPPRSRAG
mmetsp:Transcript_15463/g.35883  ORF Transcript_15463/g.35883 Transcript_15463/m.35883 type:complete len:90 (-) Transcript_15463:108-377(-)